LHAIEIDVNKCTAIIVLEAEELFVLDLVAFVEVVDSLIERITIVWRFW
jgi:hypothetical protein